MNSTVAHEEGISIVENRAYGYSRADSGWARKDQSITSAVFGDGGIYSNVEDLFKWDQSHYTNKILSDEIRNEAMTRAVLNGGEKIYYGYGWHLKNYKDNEVVYCARRSEGGSTASRKTPVYRC